MIEGKYLFTGIVIILFAFLLTAPVSGQNETPTPTPTSTPVQVNIDFTANVTSGVVPLGVLFTDITDSAGEVYFREWFFGDGSYIEVSSPTVEHLYNVTGTFTVTFNRLDEHGSHVKIKYDYITVNPVPTTIPTTVPTTTPTTVPTTTPTTMPTTTPTTIPTTTPTTGPTTIPTTNPTTVPTTSPTSTPTGSQPPAEFWGTATEFGFPVPAGSIISAWINGQQKGTITTTITGQYGGTGPFDERLKVYGSPGDTITFWLNDRQAAQVADYIPGSQNIDLTFAGSPTTTPTTQPTTTPTTSPTTVPTTQPTTTPTTTQTTQPTTNPTTSPTTVPTTVPTTQPTTTHTTVPTTIPTTSPPGPPDMYVPLYAGWNFISVPLELAEGHNTGDIFSDIDTQGRSTWRYNASTVKWEMIGKDTLLEQTQGIWIYTAQFTQFGYYFDKQQEPVNRTVFGGWNGFGIPGSNDKSARDALSSIASSWSYVIGFNGASQEYEIAIINGGTEDRSDLRHMFPAKGYWVFLNRNATFQASPPFY